MPRIFLELSPLDQDEIYMLQCSNFPIACIGQTGHKLEDRIPEHYVNKKVHGSPLNILVQETRIMVSFVQYEKISILGNIALIIEHKKNLAFSVANDHAFSYTQL